MEYKRWGDLGTYKLKECPFCGTYPTVKHIGNDHTQKKVIEIKCPECRAKRKTGAIYHGFEWLEDTAAKEWNQRPEKRWDDKYVDFIMKSKKKY